MLHAALLLVLGGSPAAAPSGPSRTQDAAVARDTWEISIAPYLWMFGLDGDVRIANQSASFDVGFDEVLENLDFALLARVEARKGVLGLYVDSIYGELSVDGSAGAATAELETELLVVDFGVLARVHESRTPSGRERAADVYLGGRYFESQNALDFAAFPDRERTTDFIDLVVGARYGMDATERLGFLFGGDVGGFGLGSSSELSWKLEGLASWGLGRAGRLWGGYRHLDVDADDGGSNGFDAGISGPLVGYEFRL